MNILIKNAHLLHGEFDKTYSVAVTDDRIAYIGDAVPETMRFDRVIDARCRLLTPAFYNAHTHAAMTLFRGYGEDLPLNEWLHMRIFPAEEHLTSESVYVASKLAIAEMIRNGIVSFSDMYFFCEDTVRAVLEMGVKANISRSVVSFDDKVDYAKDSRILEGLSLFDRYHGAGDGRVKVDLSLHAEYTNVPSAVRYMADITKERGAIMQLHLSETEKEHTECIARHGMTPTEFFYENGVFASPVVCAHCVHLTDGDRAILARNGATAVHNPVSNLKLGSGVMPLKKTLDAGINVALGTDGVASNNRLDILREMQLASLLQKGLSGHPESLSADETIALATKNGARAQGRLDCGEIKVGNKADLLLFETDVPHNLPVYDYRTMLTASAESGDISLTMADGRILYEDGEYQLTDVEKLRADFRSVHRHYFD